VGREGNGPILFALFFLSVFPIICGSYLFIYLFYFFGRKKENVESGTKKEKTTAQATS